LKGSLGSLQKNRSAGALFSSATELGEKIMRFIEAHNKNPKPFGWTKSTDEILTKVGRTRERSNNLHVV
jgi:hypothetical protein